MKRTLVILLLVVSPLALSVALGLLRRRSYGTLDILTTINPDHELRGFASYQGKLHCVYTAKTGQPRPWGWDQYEVTPGADITEIYAAHAPAWERF